MHHFSSTSRRHLRVGVKFTVGSSQLIRQAAHLEVSSNKLYDTTTGSRWTPLQYGVLDSRLVGRCDCVEPVSRPKFIRFKGTTQRSINCATCGLNMTDCAGHFGYIELEYPVFHVGFFRLIIQVLQCICKVRLTSFSS